MSGTRWLTDEELILWRSFVATSSGVISKLDGLLKEKTGLNFDDYEVLVHLTEADGKRIRMSELSDRLLYSRSRLSQRIDRMVDRGLVIREKCEDDARGTWAVLTPAGQATIESAAPHHVEHVRTHLLDHIDESELQVVARTLERLAGTVLANGVGVRPQPESSTDSSGSR